MMSNPGASEVQTVRSHSQFVR